MTYDFCVIGAGIVGLATAMRLLELRPGASLVVIEKETSVAVHQTGHNSGVIHAGIYYAPGSLKADFCRRGARATKAFCQQHGIHLETCGKLLVATNEAELRRLENLVERATLNGIVADRIGRADISRIEPNIAGIGGLLVHETGIVDYKQICQSMRSVITAAGGTIELAREVSAIKETGGDVSVIAGGRERRSRKLIACAGLQSDRLAVLSGMKTNHRIVPFRGEYFRLPSTRSSIIKHLIYPVPDPDLPFLGVHLTRMIDGSVTAGPNAVLGFAREGYAKLSFNAADVADYMRFPGFWKTTYRNLPNGVREFRNSFFKSGYLNECRKYCPSLQLDDLQPMEAGIRAQAVMRDGSLVHDFLFLETDRMLHVCNAPSPAATSAIPIGEMIANKILNRETGSRA
jgi:L-2-hydroxyglutarate oxidase